MSNKVLIIKTGNTIPSLRAENEDFEGWFIRGTGLDSNCFVCCAVDKGESLPAIDDVVAAIVTGSPAYVTDLAPWNEIAAVYLRLLHEQQKPILGVCYGHQLLALAFGGVVGFHPKGREIGTIDVELTREAASDLLFDKRPKNSAHRLHISSQSFLCRMRQCFSQRIALMHIMHSAWVHRLGGYSFILNLARM